MPIICCFSAPARGWPNSCSLSCVRRFRLSTSSRSAMKLVGLVLIVVLSAVSTYGVVSPPVPLNLRILQPGFPALALQPTNQTVTVGQSATFTASATGSAGLAYQWYFDRSPIAGATSFAYTRNGCQLSDSGKSCYAVVSNSIGGVQSSLATLTVNAGPVYFVSTNGSATSSGTSASPWPLSYALSKLAPGVTLTIMPGLYTGPFVIATAQGSSSLPMTIRSQSKWGAVIANSSSFGIAASSSVGYQASFVVFDGLCVSNNASDGIGAWQNSTIRNCWIVGNGMQGVNISSPTAASNVVECCVIENNGTNPGSPGHYHGIYLAGQGNIIRGNVIRYNNTGSGIQLYTEDPGEWDDSNYICNNLTYGHNSRYGVTMWNGNEYGGGTLLGTNFLLSNTLLDGAAISYGTACVSNNIILPSPLNPRLPIAASVSRIPSIQSDYNLSVMALSPAGAHDVVAPLPYFVNTNSGLYWLTKTSPARGIASASTAPPLDFFGRNQSAMTDVGAFQYSAILETDTRVLDPSPSDYWQWY